MYTAQDYGHRRKVLTNHFFAGSLQRTGQEHLHPQRLQRLRPYDVLRARRSRRYLQMISYRQSQSYEVTNPKFDVQSPYDHLPNPLPLSVTRQLALELIRL